MNQDDGFNFERTYNGQSFKNNPVPLYLIQDDVGLRKPIGFFKNSNFFSNKNINKSISELRKEVESKKKLITLFQNPKLKYSQGTIKKEDNFRGTSKNTKSQKNPFGVSSLTRINLGKSTSMPDLSMAKDSEAENKVYHHNQRPRNQSMTSEVEDSTFINCSHNHHSLHRKNSTLTYRDLSTFMNNLPKEGEQNPVNMAEVDFIYKKVFDKKFEYKLNPKKKKEVNKHELENADYRLEKEIKRKMEQKVKEGKPNYIQEKIKSIKKKIFFMKGIFDYSYPPIIVKKFKVLNEILNKEKKKKDTMFARTSDLSQIDLTDAKMNKIEKENNLNKNLSNLNVNANSTMMIHKMNTNRLKQKMNESIVVQNISNDMENNPKTERAKSNFRKPPGTTISPIKRPRVSSMSNLSNLSSTSGFSFSKNINLKKTNSSLGVRVISPIIIQNYKDVN